MIDGIRRMEYLAAELAAFKIGCAYIPVSLEYPKERKDMIQKDSSLKIVLVDEMLNEAVTTDYSADDMVEDEFHDEDIALIVYTSGSTGRPKGVVHTAASVYAGCQRNKKALGFDVNSRYLQTAPFTFVVTPAMNFSCMLCGAETVIMPETQARDLHQIETYIAEKKISHIFLYSQLLTNFHNRYEGLKTVVTGSDRVSGICGNGYKLINLCQKIMQYTC